MPLLAMHIKADEVVPFATMERFLDALRARHRDEGASESMIELATWDSTGSPQEHAGFGRHSNDAKNLQTAFLAKHLRAEPVDLDATA